MGCFEYLFQIQQKIDHLNHLLDNLTSTWNKRRLLYDQNLDLQQLKRDMDQLETWLSCREPILEDKNVGDSIDVVEELLRKHEDFEQTVFAQEERFNAIKRRTLVSDARIATETEFWEKTQCQMEINSPSDCSWRKRLRTKRERRNSTGWRRRSGERRSAWMR